MSLKMRTLAPLLALGLVLSSPLPATGSAIALSGRSASLDPQSESLLREGLEMLHQTILVRMPGMMDELPAPTPEDLDGLVCDTAHQPVTHGLLIGVNEYSTIPSHHLRGPENDVQLLTNALESLGVDASRLHRLTGPQASRAEVAARLGLIAAALGCGDRVIVQLSGMSMRYGLPDEGPSSTAAVVYPFSPWRATFDRDWEAEVRLAQGWDALGAKWAEVTGTRLDTDDWQVIWDMIYQKARGGNRPPDISGLVLPESHHRLLERWPIWGLESDDDFQFFLHRPPRYLGATEVLLGRELAASIALLRARGAHVIVIMDAGESDPGDLFERSGTAAEGQLRYHHVDDRRALNASLRVPALPKGAGGITVLESGVDHIGLEMPLPRIGQDRVIHGWFSFHIGQTLLDTPLADARSIVEALQAYYAAQGRVRPDFRISASDPHLVLVPEALPETRESTAIRLISPDLTRGGSRIEQPTLDLVAAVDWPARVLGVWADDEPVDIASDGTFTRNLRLQTGLNRVVLTALTGDSRLHRRVVEFGFDGDRDALKGQGTRYAVLIANERYGGDTGFSHLLTPISDARALGDVLRARFGFVTEAEVEGETLPLLLEDATRRQILRTLNRLAGVARPEDTVLIFFAGHGVSDATLGLAAWIPADFERGFPDSAIQANELENALKRFHADNLILISDSCYAGALFRDSAAPETAPEDAARIDWLLRAQSRKSRVLITSGNDQPVLDGGGGGHSVFARALLTGLAEMPQDAFTAAELFQGFLLHPVAGRVDQEPQYRTLRELGHVGGDVVFIASATPEQGAAPDPRP